MADDFTAAVAEAEGKLPDSFEFHGERFKLAEKIGLMPLMKFSHAARSGLSTADMDGMAAMLDLLRDTLDPDEWVRFERVCTEKKLDGEEIMQAVKDLIAAVTARPTKAPSDSSDGQSSTTPSSRDDSSTPATFEERKRSLGLVPVSEELSSLVG